MTGGTAVILGRIGDNFAAGMTGGMAFIYDPHQECENYINQNSVIWQIPETEYWRGYLKNLISDHFKLTQSIVAKKILDNFDNEVKNFKQICPKEMLDKRHASTTHYSTSVSYTHLTLPTIDSV